ncbi:hypothetical protein BAL199_29450 [alpha proteobacterium BAL199]|jgi:F420-dependent methylenetetrahydromethanopterin dehydrogenase|nr:hypothetical protein BAL199_29450 [alpha proteobacterium BAL199]
MGMTPQEAWQEEAYDRMVEDIIRDHRQDIILEFVTDRMASYYRQNPDLIAPATAMLNEARKLRDVSASGCLVFAYSAIEITLRDAILKPVVFGLVDKIRH